ncbi:MAG: DUF554 domain-containing protein [Ruminococcaceae bacterium]|nr:DUF554 domain-containing protein [Oscillospiraceae bacterium]
MKGLGTIINVAGIVLGGLIGLLCGRMITERLRKTLIQGIGICVLFIGIGGTLEKMMCITGGELAANGTMMMIISFVLGGLTGELINLDLRLERFGEWLKKKSGSQRDQGFVEAFVTTSITVCVGAMAIVGSLEDGIHGDYSILAAKTALDFVLVMVMTPAKGKGCIFSAIPVAILQGLTTLLAGFIAPVMTEGALHNLSLTGSMLIFCIGINLIWGNKVKVANLLPTIIYAAILSIWI